MFNHQIAYTRTTTLAAAAAAAGRFPNRLG